VNGGVWGTRFEAVYHRRLARIAGAYRDCPVCLMPVERTRGGAIGGHHDSVGFETCPMSGERFELARIPSSLQRRSA
jgi:hypothetical protein